MRIFNLISGIKLGTVGLVMLSVIVGWLQWSIMGLEKDKLEQDVKYSNLNSEFKQCSTKLITSDTVLKSVFNTNSKNIDYIDDLEYSIEQSNKVYLKLEAKYKKNQQLITNYNSRETARLNTIKYNKLQKSKDKNSTFSLADKRLDKGDCAMGLKLNDFLREVLK